MDKTEASTRESYAAYRKAVDKPQKIEVYTRLANAYNKFLFDKVFDGEEVTLPARMGTLMIVGKKHGIHFSEKSGRPLLAPHWRKTKELWETSDVARANRTVVYCTNEHSGGVRYKFLWSKNKVAIENKYLYTLRVTRTNKRRLYRAIMAGTEYYVKQ